MKRSFANLLPWLWDSIGHWSGLEIGLIIIILHELPPRTNLTWRRVQNSVLLLFLLIVLTSRYNCSMSRTGACVFLSLAVEAKMAASSVQKAKPELLQVASWLP